MWHILTTTTCITTLNTEYIDSTTIKIQPQKVYKNIWEHFLFKPLFSIITVNLGTCSDIPGLQKKNAIHKFKQRLWCFKTLQYNNIYKTHLFYYHLKRLSIETLKMPARNFLIIYGFIQQKMFMYSNVRYITTIEIYK